MFGMKEFEGEKIRVGAQMKINFNPNNVNQEIIREQYNSFILVFNGYFVGNRQRTVNEEMELGDAIKIPKTWWDHFKLRFFGEFLKKKFPVQYVTKYQKVHITKDIEEIKICPHMDLPPGHSDHIRFWVEKESSHEYF